MKKVAASVPKLGGTDDEDDTPPTDFEEAMKAAGFGLYNVLLILAAIPCITSTVFETTTLSYVLPTAECDLDLRLLDKGLLNGITYLGMILAAIPWGYIADTIGRKKALITGLVLDGIFVLFGSKSQNFMELLISKFLSGCFACGPIAIMMSYLSESHGRTHRSRVMLIVGLMKSTAVMLLPIMAYFILPMTINYKIWGLTFHSWNVFIASTSTASLMASFFLSFFPESPKFLMAQGRNAEALKTFQTIYKLNTGKGKDSYPVSITYIFEVPLSELHIRAISHGINYRLVYRLTTSVYQVTTLFEEAPEKTARKAARASAQMENGRRRSLRDRRDDAKETLTEGMKQLKPMFSRPYLALSIRVYLMNFCILMSVNTIRLWLPQLFASIHEYERKGIGASSMCAIFEYNVNQTNLAHGANSERDCTVEITPASYVNNIIVAISCFFGYILAGLTVNKIGNNTLLSFCLATACISGSGLYFSTSSRAIVILSSIFITISGISATLVISASVSLFPTAMRTMVVILIMTFGRSGSLLGNLFFPFLMSLGCLPPFLMVGGMMFLACAVSLFIPNTSKIALK